MWQANLAECSEGVKEGGLEMKKILATVIASCLILGGCGGNPAVKELRVGTDIPAGEYKITLKQGGGYFEVKRPMGDVEIPIVEQHSDDRLEFVATVAEGETLKIVRGDCELIKDAATIIAEQNKAGLGLAFDEFKFLYGAKIKELAASTGWDVGKMHLSRTDNQDFFYFKLADNVTIYGVAKDFTGELTEVTVLSTPQTADDAGAALLAYVLVVSVLSPELSAEQRGELFTELKLNAVTIAELKHGNATTIRGNVKYSTSFNEADRTFRFKALS